AILLRVTVGFDITSGGEDIWRCLRAIAHGQNLISNENAGRVVKFLEFIQSSLEELELGVVPCRLILHGYVSSAFLGSSPLTLIDPDPYGALPAQFGWGSRPSRRKDRCPHPQRPSYSPCGRHRGRHGRR